MSENVLETSSQSKNTLRPGGLEITRQAFEFCEFAPGSRILDIGCGFGATLEFFANNGIDTYGIDSNISRLVECSESPINLVQSDGRWLPFLNGYFDGIVIECTLSVIPEPVKVLTEINRLLKPDGLLIISDIYGRNAMSIPPLKAAISQGPIRSIWSQSEIESLVSSTGFRHLLWEDHSWSIRNFLENNTCLETPYANRGEYARCIFGTPSIDALSFHLLLSRARIGYFLLVAQKST